MALHTTQQRPRLHHLPATPETVHWGFFDGTLTPVLTISSGDIVSTWCEINYHIVRYVMPLRPSPRRFASPRCRVRAR